MQSQVRFNRVPKKVLEKVPEGFGAEPGQVQQGSGEGSGECSRKLWCKAKPGSTDSGEGCREGFGEGSGEGCREGSGEVRFSPFFVFVHVHASERSVKINVAAVGGTTEAYFWLFSFARKVS